MPTEGLVFNRPNRRAIRLLGPVAAAALNAGQLNRMRVRTDANAAANNAGSAADELNAARTRESAAIAFRRFVKESKAAFMKQNERIEALEQQVEALQAVTEETAGTVDFGLDFLGFGDGTSGLRRVANAWMAFVNKDDVVPNTSALALAEAIEQFGEGQEQWLGIATLVRAFGYYDAEVGLASIIQADDGAGSGSGSSDDLESVLDYLLGQGEAECIAIIEAAAAALDIELE